MKLIGVLGGMSAASTAVYYDLFNRKVRMLRGGLHSADLLLRSVDFAPVAEMQARGDWEGAGIYLAQLSRQLEQAGAEVIVLATNTMHKVIGHIEAAVTVPVVHIADATAAAIAQAGLRRPGLMATRFTMEDDFYIGRLRSRFGLDPIVPSMDDRKETHRIIYEELCRGEIRDGSRQTYVAIAERLAKAGADCLILGCTEVGLLLSTNNVVLPVFDTVALHVDAALAIAMQP